MANNPYTPGTKEYNAHEVCKIYYDSNYNRYVECYYQQVSPTPAQASECIEAHENALAQSGGNYYDYLTAYYDAVNPGGAEAAIALYPEQFAEAVNQKIGTTIPVTESTLPVITSSVVPTGEANVLSWKTIGIAAIILAIIAAFPMQNQNREVKKYGKK